MPEPVVLLAPESQARLQRGVDTLANLLALTLGPVQGGIISARHIGQPLEFLTDAATIARRFLALPDRAENAGAMLLRHLVWRLHQTIGDGCATAAVLSRALIAGSRRYLAAGANAALLRQGIEAGASAALDALQRIARPVASDTELECVARTITGEPHLAMVLAEIFDLLGPEACVTVEEYVAPYLEREYHEGGRWQARLASPFLVSDQVQQRAVLHHCAVALYAGELRDVAELRPLLELMMRRDQRRLLLAAQAIGDEALTTLVLNHQREQLQIVAVELRRPGVQLASDFDDLGALSGAYVSQPITDRLSRITAEMLGGARRVEANTDELIVVGRRDGVALRTQIARLRSRLSALPPTDREQRRELEVRIGRLAGSAATLKIGALHKVEREALYRKAERGIIALGSALREGIVPGGGVAYLHCIPAVQQVALAGDAAYGCAVVASALEAPFRQIVANVSRHDPAATLSEARRRGWPWGYDAIGATVVDMEQAGICDAAAVLRAALRVATSGAAMALTTDALILKRTPEMSLEP
jgi:chaperonin GroEL